jgi:hypothetical protein
MNRKQAQGGCSKTWGIFSRRKFAAISRPEKADRRYRPMLQSVGALKRNERRYAIGGYAWHTRVYKRYHHNNRQQASDKEAAQKSRFRHDTPLAFVPTG